MSKKSKKSRKVCRAEQAQAVVQSEPVKAKVTIAKKPVKDPLKIPGFLDQVAGKTREQIDAEREAAIKNAQKPTKQKKLVATGKGAKSSIALGHSLNLDAEGKKILKEETMKKQANKEARLRALREQQAEKRGPVSPAPKKIDPASAKALAETTKKPTTVKPAKPTSKVAQVQSRKANAKAVAKPASKAKGDGKTKLAAIGDLLNRKSGCTRKDVLAATGWPSVSMQQQAKALGVKLRMEKKPGENTRYFAA